MLYDQFCQSHPVREFGVGTCAVACSHSASCNGIPSDLCPVLLILQMFPSTSHKADFMLQHSAQLLDVNVQVRGQRALAGMMAWAIIVQSNRYTHNACTSGIPASSCSVQLVCCSFTICLSCLLCHAGFPSGGAHGGSRLYGRRRHQQPSCSLSLPHVREHAHDNGNRTSQRVAMYGFVSITHPITCICSAFPATCHYAWIPEYA